MKNTYIHCSIVEVQLIQIFEKQLNPHKENTEKIILLLPITRLCDNRKDFN